ncbi:hypothetical protein PAAG_12556 [Paracoccidioides lutzii Pb01]|uniref:Uncharacterized protein n=1 Tax=Paracoccidioides lutzii (strain ATCC MYA-826 / Pb01) TaxID=502779 RepID=A0A0A2V327_PARBA|nr:hypothetical protein PAAG_12556 [Paracoccidioides lutzii Pb01]KGQ00772.1 hypothetical protein PAAG_12556 [Paracoccidioides lutzii Pb01]
MQRFLGRGHLALLTIITPLLGSLLGVNHYQLAHSTNCNHLAKSIDHPLSAIQAAQA